MPKIQYVKAQHRYFITIPKDVVDKKRWEKGKKILFSFNERGNVELIEGVNEKKY